MKRYDEAIKLYEEILATKKNERLQQNLVSAYISKGDYLLTQAKYKESIEPFEQAVVLDSNQSYPYYGLAKAFELLGNKDLALVNYERALEIEPDKELYLKDYKAFKAANASQDELAASNITTDVKSNNSTTPVSIKPVTAGDFDGTSNQDNAQKLAGLDNLMIQKPDEQIADKVKKLIAEGDELYKSGKNTDALLKYIEVLKLTPNDAITAFKAGNLYKLENNPEKAVYYYKKAVSVNKNYADAWFNLGLVYASKKEFKSSRDCFNKVIVLSPDYAYAYYALSISYEKEGNNSKAIEYYEQYFNHESDDLTKQAVKNKINELKSSKS